MSARPRTSKRRRRSRRPAATGHSSSRLRPPATGTGAPAIAAIERREGEREDLYAAARSLIAGARREQLIALAHQAGELPGVHHAYTAQRALITGAIEGAGALPTPLLPAAYVAIAELGLIALQREAREPLLLNLTGMALYELWALDAAQELFAAALRLDPQLASARSNEEALARRRRRLAGRRAPALHRDVAQLEGRAIELARSAQPAHGMTLALCMIVRDEERVLARCLESVRDAVDELVVVDTGSRDATIDIARSFGARVIEVPWEDSFAAARNVSFDAARSDWLLYLDADETLVAEDRELLRALCGRTWREAFYVQETNLTGSLRSGTAFTNDALRVFRNRAEYRFEGRIHEQIAKRLPAHLPERIERSAVRIEHDGYLAEMREDRDKSARNLALLQKEAEEGADSAFVHFNLGTTYASGDEPGRAVEEFAYAWRLVAQEPQLERFPFAPSLASWYAAALCACGREREAIALAEQALVHFPEHTDLVLRQANAHAALGDSERALALAQRCLEMGDSDPKLAGTRGSGGFLARTLIGRILLARGEAQGAAAALSQALAEGSSYLEPVEPLVTALLAAGRSPEQALAALEEALGALPGVARFLAAGALLAGGHAEPAAAQLEILLAEEEDSRVRLALAEAQLYSHNYPAAARTAAGIAPEDPLAQAACRSELRALVLAGSEPVAQALARAGRAGLDERQLAAYRLWWALEGGAERAEGQPPPAGEELLAALGVLLDLREYRRFERLLPALADCDLEPTQRRHRLAELYLRHGFAKSAAREWMEICAREPDAQALYGLAVIASAQGMSEQAAELARQALARDPGSDGARSLLEELRRAPVQPPTGALRA
ncbi:MAG TPA: glycosyltransferase [Solirubrobacteraceae bacterium]|nr:glycosyltransferase [Solirubrobacteraceae bacterium]